MIVFTFPLAEALSVQKHRPDRANLLSLLKRPLVRVAELVDALA